MQDLNTKGVGIVAVAVADANADAVECVRPFTGDGVDAKVRIAGGEGAHIGFDGDADGVVGAAIVGFVSIADAIAAAAAAEGRDNGIDDFGSID